MAPCILDRRQRGLDDFKYWSLNAPAKKYAKNGTVWGREKSWALPWNRILLEKLTRVQLVKKLPTFYRTQRFITAFTSARHLSLSWAISVQTFHNKIHFYGEEVLAPRPTPQLRTTTCQLSVTAYSICSQPPSIFIPQLQNLKCNSITEMHFTEILLFFFCGNHEKSINTLCGQNTVFLMLKQVFNVANTIPQSIKRGFSHIKW
jgi:hypothetical protein